jgi:transposase
VNEAQREQLRAWASTEALTARDLVSRVKEEFDIAIHPNTLGTMLKRMNFVWKRTRHSLKKTKPVKVSSGPKRDRRPAGAS